MTTYHSGGFPFTNFKRVDLNKIFGDLYTQLRTKIIQYSNTNYSIYIVSRGSKEEIEEFLRQINLLRYFRGVYGSEVYEEIDYGEEYWAAKKVIYMKQICHIENISKYNIFFFDDTKMNIESAIKKFPNSILIKDKTQGLLNAFTVMDKLLNVYDLVKRNITLVVSGKYDVSDIFDVGAEGIVKMYEMNNMYNILKNDLIELRRIGMKVYLNDTFWDSSLAIKEGDTFTYFH